MGLIVQSPAFVPQHVMPDQQPRHGFFDNVSACFAAIGRIFWNLLTFGWLRALCSSEQREPRIRGVVPMVVDRPSPQMPVLRMDAPSLGMRGIVPMEHVQVGQQPAFIGRSPAYELPGMRGVREMPVLRQQEEPVVRPNLEGLGIRGVVPQRDAPILRERFDEPVARPNLEGLGLRGVVPREAPVLRERFDEPVARPNLDGLGVRGVIPAAGRGAHVPVGQG